METKKKDKSLGKQIILSLILGCNTWLSEVLKYILGNGKCLILSNVLCKKECQILIGFREIHSVQYVIPLIGLRIYVKYSLYTFPIWFFRILLCFHLLYLIIFIMKMVSLWQWYKHTTFSKSTVCHVFIHSAHLQLCNILYNCMMGQRPSWVPMSSETVYVWIVCTLAVHVPCDFPSF